MRIANKKSRTRKVFKIELYKVLSSGKSVFVEKLGYYDSNINARVLAIDTEKFGYWLNRGAKIKKSVFKLLRKFSAIRID